MKQYAFYAVIIVGVLSVLGILAAQELGRQEPEKADLCNAIEGNKWQCWKEQLERALEIKGVAGAFDVLEDFYATDPDFAADCHGYTHLIGEEAYTLYAEGKEIVLSASTSFCGYGFYHGFMETLLFTKGDIKEAREFCEYVDNQLSKQSAGAFTACYHGIGHGTVDGNDPRAWGDAQDMITPGLEMCELAGKTEYQKDLCGSGVFNSLANMYSSEQYGLSADKKDPYAICRQQTEPYFTKPCYEEMNTFVLSLGNLDLRKAAFYVQNIEDDYYAQLAIQSLAGVAAKFSLEKSIQEIIILCRSLKISLQTFCLTGFAGGFMEFGEPGREYERVLLLCRSPMLGEQERKACFAKLLWLSSVWYPLEKHYRICSFVERQFWKHCPQEV